VTEMDKSELGIKNKDWSSFFSRKTEEELPLSVILQRDFVGEEDDLGRKLLHHFFKAAIEDEDRGILILIHKAAKMACEGSPYLGDLLALSQKGWKIFVCTLSIEKMSLKEKLITGEEIEMHEIFRVLKESYKVISL
jgi:intracellular sulfur oxidation DsrE/DsrF family protein